MVYSRQQLALFAHQLSRPAAAHSVEALAGVLLNAQVDLNPHQIDAALFASQNPLAKGFILADEVGLGKTIEAGLLIAQRWAEKKQRILIITPANLRKQWHQELADKFGLSATILEAKSTRTSTLGGYFKQPGILIGSYQFAARRADEVAAIAWDLVVIDEAHRLRNVYKPDNKMARQLRDALAHAPKVLLTATPLQNSLLELYGLVSFIDERVFGDIDSFKNQFLNLKTVDQFSALKNRIAPICKRTLRRQVEAYVKYTKRITLLRQFTPNTDEVELYNLISDYLAREQLCALPAGQRQLITLVLRKLLASSSFAIAGTLAALIKRLQAQLHAQLTITPEIIESELIIDTLIADFEGMSDYADPDTGDTGDTADPGDAESTPIAAKKILTAAEIVAVNQEVADLQSFYKLALSITENAKGTALLIALKVAFAQLGELGAAQKAIIFTESARTQRYLYDLLAQTDYFGLDGAGLVLFNGSNNDPSAKRIYAAWAKRHAGTPHISGARSADMRAALVEHFRDTGSIMIAIEAGAEGINLQFCSMVINYDLPWNPQRIEQRIGRCHRYGQQHDVVVVNFLNRENEADRRVYELLDQKFQLFSGVFGASDEVLGAVESGVDFAQRIAAIYQTCRHPAQIQAAFDQLQADLTGEISDAMLNARRALLENFDEEVQVRLRLRGQQAQASLSHLSRLLMRLTHSLLAGHIANPTDHGFQLQSLPPWLAAANNVPLGHYALTQRSPTTHHYRLDHPLAQALLHHAMPLSLAECDCTLALDYLAYEGKLSAVLPLRNGAGLLQVERLTITGKHTGQVLEAHLLQAAVDREGRVYDASVTEKLLSLPGTSTSISTSAGARPNSDAALQALLTGELARQARGIVAATEARHWGNLAQETDKLTRWAGDLQLAQASEQHQLNTRMKAARARSKGAATPTEQLAAQKEQRSLETQLNKVTLERSSRQAALQATHEGLLNTLEQQLAHTVTVSAVFAAEWSLN